jgi:hypothetical protein
MDELFQPPMNGAASGGLRRINVDACASPMPI